MSTLTPAMQIAAAGGCATILWTIARTARQYPSLPARVAYPKNYGDGGEMQLPKLAVWFVPLFQIVMACAVAWGLSLGQSGTHGDPLTGLVVIDMVLIVLFFVQRNIMLRPDNR